MNRYRINITYELLKKLLKIPEEHVITGLEHVSKQNCGFIDVAGGDIETTEGALSLIDWKYTKNFESQNEEVSKEKTLNCFIDGDSLCIVNNDFINIQESECVFIPLTKEQIVFVKHLMVNKK